jgi:HD-like signal output (HDOD) protein
LSHDIGKLPLLNYNQLDYQSILEEAGEADQPLHLMEEQRLGLNHAMIGGAIARNGICRFPI